MNFLDTGTLTNAYEFEKHSIWHWPCTTNLEDTIRQTNLYKHNKNKRVIQIYKMTSEEKIDMKHALYKIYAYLHNIKERTKPINKSKLNKTVH